MLIRPAVEQDATAMSDVLREIIESTGRMRPHDPDFTLAHYIANRDSVRCSVALDPEGVVLGFQSLVRATPGNRYDVPSGWGIIGTHISPRAHRRGVGTALFTATRAAAVTAGLPRVDACIGADNDMGLRYYEAMGFRTYRTGDGLIQKRLVLTPGD
ncbi:GNAT family N-acetyltransferase [Sphingomonas sp. Leaf21]|uniref:GNAT family N-acetyltransferase n=1 Tax=Sphingomonas sp. Leaf21 TaxID=2876550 RepID=UPI001E4426F8|nr:GNAT family N-acetyltransferase [Sphingomonas sp. Leaf21]